MRRTRRSLRFSLVLAVVFGLAGSFCLSADSAEPTDAIAAARLVAAPS